MNALKHGLQAEHVIIPGGDHPEDDESNDDHNLTEEEAKALWRDHHKAERRYHKAYKAFDRASS